MNTEEIQAEFRRMSYRAQLRATAEAASNMLESQKQSAMIALCYYAGFSSGIIWFMDDLVMTSDLAPFG